MYLILLLASVVFADNDFSDFRCRCLCPPLPPVSEQAQVYFGNGTNEPSMCTSEAVVRPNIKDKEEKNEGTIEAYLHSCDCNFELRNTGTMKVIVYIYIISIVLLLMYTGFVYFITEKYQPRVSHDSDGMETPLFGESQSRSGPVEMVLTKIDSMARRWKKDVDQQRNTVFKRREALQ